ncbi:transposase family protein [Streptomyces sp. NBC_00873]|uniref:transposase family protein n=1 Tax=unclassified Streptomyces TaxID=2593676 RepID=UPI00386D9997|nr:transposase family protein [Streptomyces sp. NBC_00873]WTA41780.1 transposase family protein [Streptomyces sp. NBC_00842]
MPGLLERLAEVPDPPDPRGVRHTLAAVLALTACAVLARARSLPAVGEWLADVPPHVLAMVGARPDPRTRSRVTGCAPSAVGRESGDRADLRAGREKRQPWQAPLSQGSPVAVRQIPLLGRLDGDVGPGGDQVRHGL